MQYLEISVYFLLGSLHRALCSPIPLRSPFLTHFHTLHISRGSRSSSDNRNDDDDVDNKNNPRCHLTECLVSNTSFLILKRSLLDFLALTLPFKTVILTLTHFRITWGAF